MADEGWTRSTHRDRTGEAGRPVPDAGQLRARRLVEAHKAGDPEAFRLMVADHYGALYAQAMRSLSQPQAAEDAVQEALLRAYRGLPRFNGDYKLGAWLRRIMANVCADEGNRRRRSESAHLRWTAMRDVGPAGADDRAGDSGDIEIVRDAVERLPDSYREVLILRDVLDLTYADVASRAGISEQNARTRVHRARAALRQMVSASVVTGASVLAVFRRGLRGGLQAVQQVAPTASTISPDAFSAPARAGVAATSLIAAAAVSVAVAVPALRSAPPAPVPAGPTSESSAGVHVRSGGPATGIRIGAPASRAGIADPGSTATAVTALATTSTSTTSSSTSTSSTLPATTTTSAPRRAPWVPGVPGSARPTTTTTSEPGTSALDPSPTSTTAPPFPSGAVSGSGLAVSSSTPTSAISGPVQIQIGQTRVTGLFNGQVMEASGTDSAGFCEGTLSLVVTWAAGGAGQQSLSFAAVLADPQPVGNGVTFSLTGNGRVSGPAGSGFEGDAQLAGRLTFSANRSAATFSAEVAGGHSNAPSVCNPSAP